MRHHPRARRVHGADTAVRLLVPTADAVLVVRRINIRRTQGWLLS